MRPPLSKKATWLVRLGPLEWPRYTYARPDGDSLQLLGSVRRGPQMGALAVTTEGQYVQVVGDFITPLNKGQITRAIAKASGAERFSAPRAVARVAPVPVVIVKRRRVFVPGGILDRRIDVDSADRVSPDDSVK